MKFFQVVLARIVALEITKQEKWTEMEFMRRDCKILEGIIDLSSKINIFRSES